MGIDGDLISIEVGGVPALGEIVELHPLYVLVRTLRPWPGWTASLNIPLLGQIPINVETRERGDSGAPIALVSPAENKVSAAFHQVAAHIRAKLP